jgi:hypothetical protein
MITTETRNGRKTREYASSHFYVMAVGNKLLVVQAANEPPLHVEGQFQYLPAKLLDLMLPDNQDADLRSRICPVMLNTTESYRVPGWIFLGCVLVWCFLLWRYAFPAWNAMKEITKHPVVKRIEGWSNASEIADLAEQQLSQTAKFKGGGVVGTEDFVIWRTFYRFNLLFWNDLLWAYEKVTKETRQAILVFYGGSVTIPGSKQQVQEVLQLAAGRSPWAFFGYTPELAGTLQKDSTSFCAAVDVRRRQMQGNDASITD